MCFAVSESPEEVVEVGPLVAGAVGGGGAGEVEEVFWDVGDFGSCFWQSIFINVSFTRRQKKSG